MAAGSPPRWLDAQLLARFESNGTNCFRLAAGMRNFADWWDGRVVISAGNDAGVSSLLRQLESRRAECGSARAVYRRILKTNPGPGDRPGLLKGAVGDGEFEVLESGLRYSVNLCDGYSAGLYPDQRENRLMLRALIAARPCVPQVLNLFAHTCAFSVAAAKAGAITTSVDLSHRYLEIGKSNFARNQLSTAEHKFIAGDAMRLLPHLNRRGDKFDFIILDPPTFARGSGGRIFRLQRDFPDLLGMAVACAAPAACLLLSGNMKNLSLPMFREWVSGIVAHSRLAPGIVPEDFVGSPCSSTCWMHLP